MMGKLDGGEEKLFYAFSLEDAVPQDHLLGSVANAMILSRPMGEPSRH